MSLPVMLFILLVGIVAGYYIKAASDDAKCKKIAERLENSLVMDGNRIYRRLDKDEYFNDYVKMGVDPGMIGLSNSGYVHTYIIHRESGKRVECVVIRDFVRKKDRN